MGTKVEKEASVEDVLSKKNDELIAIKKEIEIKQGEFNEFHKKHKLKINQDHSTNADEKVAKGWKIIKKSLKELRTKRDALVEEIKEATPKKERTGFSKVYTYPQEVLDSKDPQLAKKKYRAEQRRLKKGGKPRVEGESLKPKKEKVAETETEAPKKVKKAEATVEAAPLKKKKKED